MTLFSGDQECEQALWAAIQRLTQEQLGQGILDSLSSSISQVWALPQARHSCSAVQPIIA